MAKKKRPTTTGTNSAKPSHSHSARSPSDLFQIADGLDEMAAKLDRKPLDKLVDSAESIAKSWSGSCLGYHSRVYYGGFQPTPAGARFSQQWGFMDRYSNETIGEWQEYEFDSVIEMVHRRAGNPNLEPIKALAVQARGYFEDSQPRLLSILSRALVEHPGDTFLKELEEKIKTQKILTRTDLVNHLMPSGKFLSSDMTALTAGIQLPPHLEVYADAHSLEFPFDACEKLGKLARQAASHLENAENRLKRSARVGTNVFIGHGRSRLWKDLKDFIQDRVHLPWDEFNRVPIAGVTNVARLARMLDEAAIAFLIMTAEDEHSGGALHARMNVAHEVGLFQGRLGFEKAIVLLEEGCQEFSNIHGLGQIRFPAGNISAVFEDVRAVLEREGLIDQP